MEWRTIEPLGDNREEGAGGGVAVEGWGVAVEGVGE